MADAPVKAQNLLNGNQQEFEHLLQKVKKLQALQAEVEQYFEPEVKPYVQVANLIGKKLILIVANGTIATHIRFQTVDLLRRYKTNTMLQNIETIECKVRPNQRVLKPIPKNPVCPLSKETAALIQAMADGLEDEKLREVMQRIAKHSERGGVKGVGVKGVK